MNKENTWRQGFTLSENNWTKKILKVIHI